jgi:hypothetical protein
MQTYEYLVAVCYMQSTPNGLFKASTDTWMLSVNWADIPPLVGSLVEVLNILGSQGWHLVGIQEGKRTVGGEARISYDPSYVYVFEHAPFVPES